MQYYHVFKGFVSTDLIVWWIYGTAMYVSTCTFG